MLRADCRVLLVHLFLRSEYTSLRASVESTLESSVALVIGYKAKLTYMKLGQYADYTVVV